MMRALRSSGFTLFEILAATGIMLIIAGVSLTALRAPNKKRTADSAAGVILTALQAAQSEARAKGLPTGVALAYGDGGSASHGFYVLQGQVRPRVKSVTDLRSEFPNAYLTVAAWGSGLSRTIPDSGEDFIAGTWAPPHLQDPILIFLPSGKVLSNNLYHKDGVYRLVVSSGFDGAWHPSGGGGDPEAPTLNLSRAADPWTVQVSQAGDISLQKGLPDNPGVEGPTASAPTTGQLPTLSVASGEPPEILEVRGLPEYQEDMPAGIDAMIPEQGVLSLQVKAWSPDGEPLYAKWSGPGQFSSQEPIPLEWEPLEGVWKGTVEYRLPTTLHQGDDLTLRVRVADRHTDVEADLVGAVSEPLRLAVTEPQGKLAFVETLSREISSITQTTNKINDDGTSENILYHEALSSSDWSPDGTKLVGVMKNRTLFDLVVFHPNLGPVRTLITSPRIVSPKWSPDGTQVAFLSEDDLYVVRADGSSLRQLTPSDGRPTFGGLSWSEDSQRIVFTESVNASHESPGLWIATSDGSSRSPIPIPLDQALLPRWIPVDDRIAFLGLDGVAPSLYTVDPDGGDLVQEIDCSAVSGYGHGAGTTIGMSSNRRFLSVVVNLAGDSVLRIKDRTTGQVRDLPNYGQPGTDWGLWSPVAERVAGVDLVTRQLYTMQPDGGVRLELTKDARQILNVSWGR